MVSLMFKKCLQGVSNAQTCGWLFCIEGCMVAPIHGVHFYTWLYIKGVPTLVVLKKFNIKFWVYWILSSVILLFVILASPFLSFLHFITCFNSCLLSFVSQQYE